VLAGFAQQLPIHGDYETNFFRNRDAPLLRDAAPLPLGRAQRLTLRRDPI
jgi:hypothetical protein